MFVTLITVYTHGWQILTVIFRCIKIGNEIMDLWIYISSNQKTHYYLRVFYNI